MAHAKTLRGVRYFHLAPAAVSVLMDGYHRFQISKWARDFFWGCLGEDRDAMLAVKQQRVIGMFAFLHKDRTLYACGTYVGSAWRGRGLGRRLWDRAIDMTRPQVIDVDVISAEGDWLVRSIEFAYPRIEIRAKRMMRAA